MNLRPETPARVNKPKSDSTPWPQKVLFTDWSINNQSQNRYRLRQTYQAMCGFTHLSKLLMRGA